MHFINLRLAQSIDNTVKKVKHNVRAVCYSMKDRVLTVFPVEADLPLVLLLTLQSFVHLLDDTLAGLVPVEEAAGARPLHHLCPHKAGQLTEAI